MPINSRQKGARGERELAKLLREYGYTNARRGQQYCGTSGDADITDAIPNVHIECKRVENLNIDKALDQSIRDSKDNEIPVVMHRKNNTKWKVTMRLNDFIDIYKGNKKEGEE